LRLHEDKNLGVRTSALWGKPAKGDKRASALWGKGGRGFFSALVITLALAAPAASTAHANEEHELDAYVAPALYEAAKADPKRVFDVIVQGDAEERSAAVARHVRSVGNGKNHGLGVTRRFATIAGVSAKLTGKQILKLAGDDDIFAITENAPIVLAHHLTNKQAWPNVTSLTKSWDAVHTGYKAPTIAIVDSGLEPGRADFSGRVVKEVTMTALVPNSPGDGRGHGTFVAGIAAGLAPGYTGAAPNAGIVSIDVMDDNGMAMTADVIAAADWIYQNKDAYNIRVANFSLHSAAANSFMFDPLDKAVEKLWFAGVVVVAAVGNYGVNGQPSGVPFAPGNDPFVITVGAADIGGTVGASDDFNAPWSAYGYTLDGFAKPELGAPGRYMVGPVPMTSTLVAQKPGNVVTTGYMQLSGTSFAAPLVAGAAAHLLSLYPSWTPDQVKGALMLTAKQNPSAAPNSIGVGQLFVDVEKLKTVGNPPNPNAALNRFVISDPAGGSGKVFDAASWASTAFADASWASASWASASWASASWASASWASASWASASWASASWASQAMADASWASASWASASWASLSYEDNADDDVLASGGYWLEADNLALTTLP
jgi:serine protease AprX